MKKLILLFILTLFGMSRVVAQDNNPSQTTDLKAYVDSLSTKLNTLQHDYDYRIVVMKLISYSLNLKI